MSKLLNIVAGWSKALGLIGTSTEEKQLSTERLRICAECPAAKESSFLKFIQGNAHDLGAIYCSECGCPVNEKSLVKNETCPLGKWGK